MRARLEMGPLITREHRDKVASYVEARRARARRSSSTAARARPATASSSAHADRQRQAGHEGLRRRDLRPRARRSSASTRTRRRVAARSTTTRTATARRSSPATAAPPGSSSSTSRPAWSASTSRSPCRSATTASAAGRRGSSATRHIYGPEGIDFYTRSKVVTSRWPDPATSRVELGFPQTALTRVCDLQVRQPDRQWTSAKRRIAPLRSTSNGFGNGFRTGRTRSAAARRRGREPRPHGRHEPLDRADRPHIGEERARGSDGARPSGD